MSKHQPQNKDEFKQYCLRRLGSPVLEINMADDQIEDCIADALQTFREKHYDATEDQWYYYELTASDAATDYYIDVPEEFLGVYQIRPAVGFGAATSGGSFSPLYQVMLSELDPWSPFDRIDYFMKISGISELNNDISTDNGVRFEFIRHEHKIRLYHQFKEGTGMLWRVFRFVDEGDDTKDSDIWNDKWLKAYATALLKFQWGENLGKFSGVQLLGGETINADRLIQEAQQEIENLTEQLETTYMLPTDFIFG